MKRLLTLSAVVIAVASTALRAAESDTSDGMLFAADVPTARLDSAATRTLALDIDATLFFRNDEFASPLQTGYTLPGFRICPAVSYTPVPQVRIEAGLYALKFWGTDRYPNLAYLDLPQWTGGNTARGFHLLPHLRAAMSTKWGLTAVLGTLYGGASHHLPEPLYASELNLTADPEAGVQLLYENKRLHADMWLNWESFIYRGSRHQEAFMFGLSSRVRYTRPTSAIDLYSPVALLIQHRGGEIDDTETGIQTLLNAQIGVGISHRMHRRWFGGIGVEASLLAYRQLAGELWPHRDGTAWYVDARATLISGLTVDASWMRSDRFISLMEYPLYGTLSTRSTPEVFHTVSTLHAGVDYHYTFSPGYTLGADADIYFQPALTGTTLSTGLPVHHAASTSYTFGVYMRICPSFLLKRF